MSNRRESLRGLVTAGFVVGPRVLLAGDRRRVFVAGFSHETNTFHPVPTASFGFAEVSRMPVAVWNDRGLPDHDAKILAATLFVGCAWTDSPDMGMSVMITADGSRTAARAAAVYLARKVWEARRQFDFGCETAELEEGVSRALAAKESTVFLTDSGDNVTASAPGDLPIVLRHLVERNVRSAVVAGINDTPAVTRCFGAGAGQRVSLSLGCSVETRFGPPLRVDAQVVRLIENPRMAVVRIGEVEATLAAGPMAFTDPRQFPPCGIDPLTRKIVVVKEGYLYDALTRIAPRYIMLLTPGAGDMRIERLTYTRRRRPLFPLDSSVTFDPEAAGIP